MPSNFIILHKNDPNHICFGFCRTWDWRIPCDIIQLCYFYYFTLYCAENIAQIQSIFGDKVYTENNKFIALKDENTFYLRLKENNRDSWDKTITNKKNDIGPANKYIVARCPTYSW